MRKKEIQQQIREIDQVVPGAYLVSDRKGTDKKNERGDEESSGRG